MVDVFSGRLLINRDGHAVDPEQALENKVVGLYFSAAWCSLCREFTPTLCDFYSELVEDAHPAAPFEIVFISSDRSAEEMVEYMRSMHGDWLALPFHDPLKQFLGLLQSWYSTAEESGAAPPPSPLDEYLPEFFQCELKKKYNITAIPKLVIVKQTGEVITDKGRKQIRERGLNCFRNWLEGANVFQNFCS
ncbi:Nucleoredoxin-like protein 2 [Varanus komodoensis]|nr:Nucleoredoxin-like protein 2 [Varanus komodoensis]